MIVIIGIKMLIRGRTSLVSAGEQIRRQVRDACHQHLSPQMQVVELDYQPK